MASVLLTLLVTDGDVLYVTDGPREVWEAAACGCAPLDCMKEDGKFPYVPM